MRQMRSDTVKRYLEEYKGYPASSLAKLILAENKELFEYSPLFDDSARQERIRYIIRVYTGQAGSENRRKIKDDRFYREARTPHPHPPELKDIEPEPKPINILFIDIETMPMLGWLWGIWEQNVALNQLESDWFIASVAWKWAYTDEIEAEALTIEEITKQDDKRLMGVVWGLLEEADVVIAHNAEKFDIPRINTRFLLHSYPPPMPYQIIDTLKVARKRFSLTSNKLDYLAKFLGVGEKIDTGGFELWRRCMSGEEEAILEMIDYNKHDIFLLEGVYKKLRPYIASHPNIGLFTTNNVTVCPACGSTNIKDEGSYNTLVGSYAAYRCTDCGSISRQRVASETPSKRKSLLISVAR